MKKTLILAAVLTVMGAATALAQGIVVNKTDGTKVYYNASEVVSVTTFGYGEGPHAPAGAEAIDLGLPSGTLWANMNVGANAPEESGDYFAWGETKPKDVYNWETYQHGNSWDNVVNIGSDIAGTVYDAATANWGSLWCMPTKAQCDELKKNCSAVWTQQNGVNGRIFTGPNGSTIFLPAAGYCWDSDLDRLDSGGYCWSSTLNESDQGYACSFFFDSGYLRTYSAYRYGGHSVRPVQKK